MPTMTPETTPGRFSAVRPGSPNQVVSGSSQKIQSKFDLSLKLLAHLLR